MTNSPEVTRATALVPEALAVKAWGGLLLPAGHRRRPPGSIFFHLIKTHVTHPPLRP